MQLTISSEQSEFISDHIRRFRDIAPLALAWLTDHVERHRALPLYVGWTATLAIRADGELIRWSTEETGEASAVVDVLWINLALVQGAKIYPVLASLVPSRPADAVTCSACGGSGVLSLGRPELSHNVICRCGGTGWIPISSA